MSENRLDVAPESIQDEQISQEMPRIAVEQHRGDELPRISIVDATIAQRKIIADETGLERIEKKLCDKTGNIQADQRQQNNASVLLPRPRKQ